MVFRSKILFSTVCMAALSACGSGGSGSSAIPSPITTAAVPPTPTPTPTPAPPENFNTAEYRRSNGLDNINALAAYNAGGTGEGVIIAIVDSGIDLSGNEFSGRIHPNSTNTANPGTTFDDQDGHGTFVASVAAGANDGISTHGVAFDAQILALRTDDGDSCSQADGCSHFDIDIAAAIDVADQAGAKVANLSLGGGGAAFSLRSAIDRATQNGMIVVISAGNDGDAEPDSFALVGQTRNANGRVLIAGYVDDNNVISANSNRAGNAADIFVVAPGVNILATGLDEERFLVSGSSFAAPHVSGAIAVLYDLFPNLSADDMVDLITSTATDLGAPGIDDVYGHGLINLEEAVLPQGTIQTEVAAGEDGTTTLMVEFNSNTQTSTAFGDAVALGLTGQRATGIDRFSRAYEVDLAPFAQSQRPQVSLSGVLDSRQSSMHSALSTQGGTFFAQVSLQQQTPLNAALLESFSGAFADRADERQMTGRVTAQFDGITVKSSFGLRPDPVLQPAGERSLISLRDTDGATYGLGDAPSDSAIAASYTLNSDFSVTAQANWAQQFYRTAFNERQESQLWQSALSLTYRADANSSAALSLGVVQERGQVFGAAANGGALSLGSGARTLYAQASYQTWLGAKTYITTNAAYGSTQLNDDDQASLLQASGALGVSSWSAGLRSVDAFANGDTVILTFSQPQRVESGSAALTAAGTATITSFSLAPTGRQIDSEIAYHLPIKGWGALSANALVRRDLGHVAAQNDVAGFVRFTSGF